MMNTESKTIKPKNDFQYSNHCVWKELRNDSGAGADADEASRIVDMTLYATEPLAEIVWSPNKGFSLNCVDPSFSDKNASLYKDVRPSSMVFALLQSVDGGNSNSDTPMDDVSVNPITVICTNSGISSMDTPSRHPSDQAGAIIPECKTHKEHDTGLGGIMEKIYAGRGELDLHNDQKVNLMNYCEKNICDQAKIGTVIISDTKGNKSSATSATSVALVPICDEDGNKSKANGMMLPCNEDLPVLHFPCNSRIHKATNKTKENSSFDGNAYASLSKEENSLFLTGKKRCNFQRQLMIESKRIKKKIQETSCSTSKVKGHSSFMNMISNMMKGLSSQSTQDEGNLDHHFLWSDKKLIRCNGSQDPESKNPCFDSNSKSTSWPRLNNLVTMKSHQVGDSSKDFEPGNKVQGLNVTPLNFYADNSSFYNQYLQSDEFEASTRACGDLGPSLRPKIRPIHFLGSQENRKTDSVDNKNCYHLGLSNGKEGLVLNSSPTGQDKSNNENFESYAPLFHKSDCFINKEASIGVKGHKENNDHTSKHKLNHITPFSGWKDYSEPMTSILARRLGAIKNILTDTTDNIPHK